MIKIFENVKLEVFNKYAIKINYMTNEYEKLPILETILKLSE